MGVLGPDCVIESDSMLVETKHDVGPRPGGDGIGGGDGLGNEGREGDAGGEGGVGTSLLGHIVFCVFGSFMILLGSLMRLDCFWLSLLVMKGLVTQSETRTVDK